jgi:membrane protein YdbS with pleckstrin-like domain
VYGISVPAGTGSQANERLANKKDLILDTVQRLSEMRLFGVMSDTERAQWASRFRREQHSRGRVVFRQGDRATALYIVDRGELRARARIDGEEMPVAYFYPGGFFGETGLLTEQPRNATVDVLTDAELLVLDKLEFDRLMEEFPDIREQLLMIGREREAAGRTRFHWERPDEVTLFFSTKHWSALLRALRWTFLLGFLAFVATAIYVGAEIADLPAAFLMIVAGASWAFTLLLFIYQFFDWRNDHYIITTLRVLHVERVLLLREDRDEAPIERVQDVQIVQEGVLANVLDYGHAIIQTAAATQRIVFAHVPHPDLVQEILFAPLHHAESQERAEMREAIRQELGQRLDIPVSTLEDRDEAEKGEEPESSDEIPAKGKPEDAFDLSTWLRAGWQWIRNLFTFETWIESDGGNTVTWRKNGWRLVGKSLLPVFLGLVGMGVFSFSLSQGLGFPWVPLLLLVLLIINFGWWFYRYWDWQNDIYQISGNRLVDLKKRPLFLEELRRETTLDKVQNVGLSIPGPMARTFNYGTVVIETAGEIGAFEFEYVHDPRRVQEEIFNRMEGFRRQQREAEMLRRHGEMAEWFEIYDELRQRQRKTETSKE